MLADGDTIADANARAAAESSSAPAERPTVSVVIPCLNEERFIGEVLDNLGPQYDPARFEIVVVDGRSEDATRARVEEFAARHPDLSVRIVDNPARHIPTALNLGVSSARGEIVVRMDAHSVPSPNYVRRSVELLAGVATEGGEVEAQEVEARELTVVGMPWRIRPGAGTTTARAIASAVAHPFGVGDAQYRLAAESNAPPREVDTVPFGVFRKNLWQRLGGFDERLLANEDYDFNYRVRQAGGRVLLDTSAHCDYFARPTAGALARQYFRYGNWKARMLRRWPRSVRWRQLVAPAFVAALSISALVATAAAARLLPALAALPLALVAIPYALASAACAAQISLRARDFKLAPALVAVFFVIHAAWGAGFLLGLARRPS